jgi:hypothetical protein
VPEGDDPGSVNHQNPFVDVCKFLTDRQPPTQAPPEMRRVGPAVSDLIIDSVQRNAVCICNSGSVPEMLGPLPR